MCPLKTAYLSKLERREIDPSHDGEVEEVETDEAVLDCVELCEIYYILGKCLGAISHLTKRYHSMVKIEAYARVVY